MFDELGNGWPRHSCFYHAYSALKSKVLPILHAGADPTSGAFKPFADLKDKFDPKGQSPTVDSPPAKNDGTKSGKILVEHIIKKMSPIAGDHQFFIGVVRAKETKSAAIDAAYAALGDVGQKVFDLPARSNAIQLTIVDAQGEPNESYTGIIDRKTLDKGVAIGVMVGATFKACVSPSASLWLITEIIPL